MSSSSTRNGLGERRHAKTKAAASGLGITLLLALAIVVGSRRLAHFDAALVGYTFATLFAAFGVSYRYAMWLQRPPTRLYWRRGWQVFFRPRFLVTNVLVLARRVSSDFIANRFIWRRGKARWAAHWFIMWGCLLAIAITFPLVFGWIHFETIEGNFDWYRAYIFGFPTFRFPIHSIFGFIVFHGLVWASILVIIGVMLAMRRRMRDHGAAAVQQFGEDFLPLILLFSISLTGLMLTASYSWMKGYAYDFLTLLHAVTVIFTLLWLPFGKFFHIVQRPAQLGVSFYKDVGSRTDQAACHRCGEAFASVMMVNDLITVQKQLGFNYEIENSDTEHYAWICPKCRRAMFGMAQSAVWNAQSDAATK
jgi:hypothetical protein